MLALRNQRNQCFLQAFSSQGDGWRMIAIITQMLKSVLPWTLVLPQVLLDLQVQQVLIKVKTPNGGRLQWCWPRFLAFWPVCIAYSGDATLLNLHHRLHHHHQDPRWFLRRRRHHHSHKWRWGECQPRYRVLLRHQELDLRLFLVLPESYGDLIIK